MTRAVTIAAGGTYAEKTRAKVFVCLTTTSTSVTVSRDGDKPTAISSNKGFGSPGETPFNRLEFFNPTTASVTFSFYVGDEEYKSFTFSKTDVLVIGGGQTVTPGGTVVYPGIDPGLVAARHIPAGAKRSEIRIQNRSATLPIEIQLYWPNIATWFTAMTILAGAYETLPGAYDIQLYNPAASSVSLYIFETYDA